MEQNKNCYSKFKLSKFEIIMLIIAGVFLILAIADKLIKVKADSGINRDYVAFVNIKNSWVQFLDNEGEVLLELPRLDDLPNPGFEYALDSLLYQINPSECLVFLIDDYATLSVYEYVSSELTKRGIIVQPYNADPSDINLDGFTLNYYRAGSWEVPLYVRSSLILSPSPSPIPDPSMQDYHILLNHVNGVYDHTSYMVSFKASGILGEYNQPLNSTVESVLLESGYESTLLKYNASIMKTGKYQGSWLTNYYGTGYLFYIKCSSFSDLKLYKNSNAFASENFEYIENNYSYTFVQEGSLQNQGSGYDVFYYVSEIDDGYILAFSFKTGEYGIVSDFNQSSDIWFQEGNINSSSNINYLVPFQDNSDQYKLALTLMLDINNSAVPDPNVTPTPSPSPEPTAPPYIQLITPPLPSPAGTIGFQDPGYPKINTGAFENELGDYENKLQNNKALGLLAVAFGFVPLEVRSIIWLILLLGVILATIRVFLHFFS